MVESHTSTATRPFRRLLREARRQANLTQAALAERAGLSTRTVEHLEEGRGQPYPDTAQRLADALELAGETRIQFELAARRPLPSTRESLKSGIAHAGTLPLTLSSFVGREREVAAVTERLRDPAVRLVTLTGPGGTGKTRVGVQVATELIDLFDDGVFFVDLAPIGDPSLAVSAIAQSLGIRDVGKLPVLESLKAYLHDKRVLLLLDNFEQILVAAPAVAELLVACAGLKILVTSRAALHLRGEHEHQVPPLALPESGQPLPPDAMSAYGAVMLFVQRAAEVQPDFTLSDENAPAVAEICRRLDGLPLALELAAARVKLLPPLAMLSRLGRRLPLLTGGARDLPARQRTLSATIAWSYELLEETEQRLFRELAVFVGGCTLEAINAVCAGGSDSWTGSAQTREIDLLDRLASLLDKSLLRQQEGPAGEPRFSLLETIREYSGERLVASGEAEAISGRHADYYLGLVEVARPRLRGPQARTWLDRLEADHNNLHAAIDWAEAMAERADERGDASGAISALELATRIVEAAAWFWMLRSHLLQGWQRVDRLVKRAPMGTPARARALLVAGTLAHFRGDDAEALRLSNESLLAWRALGDSRHVALALVRMADAQARLGGLDRARALLEESQALSDDTRHQSDLEHPLVVKLAMAAWAGGDLDSAGPLFEQGVAIGRADGDIHTTLLSLRYLGLLADQRGDVERSRALQADALRSARELGDFPCTMYALAGLAYIAVDAADAKRAARLLAAVSRLHELTGMTLSPSSRTRNFEQSVALVRSRLGDAPFAAAWAEGRAMPLEHAIAVALEEAVPV